MKSSAQHPVGSLNIKEWSLIVALYVLSQGLSLFNRGVFRDDWVNIFNAPIGQLIVFAKEGYPNATVMFGILHNLFSNTDVLPYRGFIFVLFLAMTILFERVLATVREIGDEERFFLTAFFVTIPFDGGRTVLTLTHCFLSYFFFWFGFFVVSRRTTLGFRLIALAFFFLAFFTPSHLVLYAVVPLYLIYKKRPEKSFRGLIRFGLRHLDFLALPWLFWTVRAIAFPPDGGTYNAVTVSGLANAPIFLALSSFEIFQDVADKTLHAVSVYPLQTVVVTSALFFLFHREYHPQPPGSRRDIAFGLFAFVSGLFPFATVGHIPNLTTFKSKHTWSLAFGAAFLIYGAINAVLRALGSAPPFKRIILCFLVAAFLLVNVEDHINFLYESHKRLAIAFHLRESETARRAESFDFNDFSDDAGRVKQPLIPLDCMGILQLAMEDAPTRTDYALFRKWVNNKYSIPSAYTIPNPRFIGGVGSSGQRLQVYIREGDYRLTRRRILKLAWLSLFDPAAYTRLVKTAVGLQMVASES